MTEDADNTAEPLNYGPAPLPKRFGQFHKDGSAYAFYSDDVYDGSLPRYTVPADAVPLTEKQYRDLLSDQPWTRFIDGEVVFIERPPPPPPPKNPLDEILSVLTDMSVRLNKLEGERHHASVSEAGESEPTRSHVRSSRGEEHKGHKPKGR